MDRPGTTLKDLFGPGRNCCVMGIGNLDRGDDGFGVRFAELLRDSGWPSVFIAETTPENHIGRLADGNFTDVLLVDAVDAGAKPGTAVFLDAAGIDSRFPQVSTHKLSLAMISRVAIERYGCKAWLLGVQPTAVQAGAVQPMAVQPTAVGTEVAGRTLGLSPVVEKTMNLLIDEILTLKTDAQPRAARSGTRVLEKRCC